MKKKTLDARVKKAKNETAEALNIVLGGLKKGWIKQLVKDEKVARLFEIYEIEVNAD